MKIRTTIAVAACAVGMTGLVASSAQATPTWQSQLCGTAYTVSAPQGNLPEFDSPLHGSWRVQGRFTAAERRGDYTAPTTYQYYVGSTRTSSVVNCWIDYHYLNGFGEPDTVHMQGWASYSTYSDGTRYPTAFGTDHRYCDTVHAGGTGPFTCSGGNF